MGNFAKQIEGTESPAPSLPSFPRWASLFPLSVQTRKPFPPQTMMLYLPRALFALKKGLDKVNIYKNNYNQMPSPTSRGHAEKYLQERASLCGTTLRGGDWSIHGEGNLLYLLCRHWGKAELGSPGLFALDISLVNAACLLRFSFMNEENLICCLLSELNHETLDNNCHLGWLIMLLNFI